MDTARGLQGGAPWRFRGFLWPPRPSGRVREIEFGEQRLVYAALPPEADIPQRIEHVCFVP